MVPAYQLLLSTIHCLLVLSSIARLPFAVMDIYFSGGLDDSSFWPRSRASLPPVNAGNFSGDSLLICFDLVCFFIPFHRVPLPLSSIPQSFPSFSSVFTPCLMSCSYILFPFKQVSAGQLGCECLGSFEKLVAYALTPVTKAITK